MTRSCFMGMLLCIGMISFSYAQTKAPAPFGPVPNENQMKWQEMEYYAFVHFSLNTYADQSWGYGNEDINLFNPIELDCRQWARICKQAGMKGIIITAKHHSGFCLWPSKYTGYSVKNAPWKNGNGDIVREMADARKEYGLKLGIYLSPWDRNHPGYGKPEYIAYFRLRALRNTVGNNNTGYAEIDIITNRTMGNGGGKVVTSISIMQLIINNLTPMWTVQYLTAKYFGRAVKVVVV